MEKETQRVWDKNINYVFDQCRKNVLEITSDDLRNKLLDTIQIHENTRNDFKLNVYMFGTVSVGKTELIKNTLATMNEEYKDLLVSDRNENTYFFVSIEKSNDQKISSQIDNKEIVFYNDIKDLKKLLEKMNKDGKEINKKNTLKATKSSKKFEIEMNQKSIPIIKICLPDFDANIRLIDCPGASSFGFLSNQIRDMVLQNKFANVLMYIISTEQLSIVDRNIFKVIDSIMVNSLNTKMYFSINKLDKLAEEIEDSDESQLDSLKEHLEDIFSSLLNLEKRYKFKTLGVMPLDIKTNKGNVNKILKDLQEFYTSSKEEILIRGILPNLKYDITRIYNEHYKGVEDSKDLLVNSLKKKSKIIAKKIQDALDNQIGKFMEIKSLDVLKDKYPNMYYSFENEFKKRDDELTSTYLKRNTYIKDQVSVLGKYIETKYDEQLIKIYGDYFKEIFEISDKLDIKEYEKIKNIMKLHFDVDISESENIGLLIFSNLLGYSARYIVMELVAEGAAIVFLPVIGWAIGIGLAIISVKNYIGIWSKNGCKEDVFKTIIDTYNDNNPKKVVNIIQNYYKVMERIFGTIAARNYTNKELDNLMKLINSFVIESIENELELKKMFETRMINNYSDTTKGTLKPFFESLKYEAMPEDIDDDDED